MEKNTNSDLAALVRELRTRAPLDAAELLAQESPDTIERALKELPPAFAARVAAQLPGAMEADSPEVKTPGEVAELMEPVRGVLPPETTVAVACEFLRHAEEPNEITYLYVADAEGKLLGLVVMRDLILARPEQTLAAIMIRNPFRLTPRMAVGDAVKAAIKRHYPVYPVCETDGRVAGVVRGWRLFERQAIEITAQSGQMVGVNKQERVETPVRAAFNKRHPWLQVNLLTAFLDVFVVGMFSGTIEKIVALAAFLPVLAGQSGNTGCQALAITLRGMTLGDLDSYPARKLIAKEVMLGMLNGLFTGFVAGAAMYWYSSPSPDAPKLALTIFLAMISGCTVAGLAGVMIPLTLRKFGADPVTASAIFLTTATDIAGMGLMLFLATAIVIN